MSNQGANTNGDAGEGLSRSPLSENNYLERLGALGKPLWPSFQEFTCPVCREHVDQFQGLVLKTCLIHHFCQPCLKQAAIESGWSDVDCPLAHECDGKISSAELRELFANEPELLAFCEGKKTRREVENDLTQLQEHVFDNDLHVNLEEFECSICLETVAPLQGLTLRHCGEHYFCTECMRGAITNADNPLPCCPGEDCSAVFLELEVQKLEPSQLSRLQNLGVERAVAAAGNEAFHCMVPDCNGKWYISEVDDGRFNCPVCNEVNCVKCEVVHANGKSCRRHRRELAAQNPDHGRAEDETKAYIQRRLQSGFAMICPKCSALCEKISGCQAIVCTKCRTELCWATKGYRWGPGGFGDTSGGCRCMVNGIRCSPHCTSSCDWLYHVQPAQGQAANPRDRRPRGYPQF